MQSEYSAYKAVRAIQLLIFSSKHCPATRWVLSEIFLNAALKYFRPLAFPAFIPSDGF